MRSIDKKSAGSISSMKFGVVLAALLVASGAQAQTAEVNPALAKVIAAAKAEGKLVLRSQTSVFGAAEGAKVAQDGIKNMFGADLDVEWSPGTQFAPLAAAIFQEMQAGQAASSDVYTGTAVQITPYLDRGAYRTVDWAALMPSRIEAGLVEGDGKALRVMTFLPGILYNLKAAPWVPEINTLADLLKPQYKGKFYTTAFLAGFDVLLADEVWGPAKTEDYIRRLSPQVAGLLGCEGYDRIASGEVPAFAIDCSGAAPNNQTYRGKDILAVRIVSDLAEKRLLYVTIPSNAAHPNAAILYTLYLASAEGQDRIVWNFYGGDLDDFRQSHAHQTIVLQQERGVHFIDVTIDWWRTHPGIEKAHLALTKLIRER
jgi:hypothetical protein